jgi:capsular polysaccharide biosynthesis protein
MRKLRFDLGRAVTCLAHAMREYVHRFEAGIASRHPCLFSEARLLHLAEHLQRREAFFGELPDKDNYHFQRLLSILKTSATGNPMRAELRGWAVHPHLKQNWHAVVVCADGHIVGTTQQRQYRADIHRLHGVRRAGFRVSVDPALLPGRASLGLYALYRNGTAIPLKHVTLASLQLPPAASRHPAVLTFNNRHYTVLTGIAAGYLDRCTIPASWCYAENLLLSLNNDENVKGSVLFPSIASSLTAELIRSGRDHIDALPSLPTMPHTVPFSKRLPRILKVTRLSQALSEGLITLKTPRHLAPTPSYETRKSEHHALRRREDKDLFSQACGGGEFVEYYQQFALPEVFPDRIGEDRPQAVAPRPKAEMICANNVEINHRCITIVGGSYLVLDPSADPSFRFIAGLHRTLVASRKKPNVCALTEAPNSERRLASGVLLDGRCSENYFHWLVEYLPRLHTLEAYPEVQGIPLIVNSAMHPNMKRLLTLLRPGDSLFWNTDSVRLTVERLYYPSMLTFIPDDATLPPSISGALPQKELLWLKSRLLAHIPSKRRQKDRIYLKRKAKQARGICNEREVISEFLKRDFRIVDPSELDILEQIALFHSAEAIAGNGGAAFANLLFCQPGTTIVMTAMEDNKNYCFFSHLASMNQCRLMLVTGPSEQYRHAYSSPVEYLHAPYWVPHSKLRKALDYLQLH